MDTGFLSVDSLDDIVFEGRNKAYGAYVLRQEYPLQVIKATSISLLTLFLFIICLVLWGQHTQFTAATESSEINDRTLTLIPEPKLPKAPAKPIIPATEITPPTAATKAFREIKIVSDLTPVTANIPEQNSFSHAEPGLVTTVGDLPATNMTAITDEPSTASNTATESNSPFEVVEKMPEFPDGLTAMYKFISKHLRYPAEAQSRGLESNVILTFVVSATGQISDIIILQDIGGGAGEEAKRVVSLMPHWRPGLQHNRAVPVRFTLPVRFQIN